jgi:hypothetical protein
MRDPNLSLQQSAALLAAAPLESEPGTTFCYSNTAMQVAGAAVEAVTGQLWHEVRAALVVGSPVLLAAVKHCAWQEVSECAVKCCLLKIRTGLSLHQERK